MTSQLLGFVLVLMCLFVVVVNSSTNNSLTFSFDNLNDESCKLSPNKTTTQQLVSNILNEKLTNATKCFGQLQALKNSHFKQHITEVSSISLQNLLNR